MSYSDLKGKTYIITGAASGQCRSTAIFLARQGANVGLLDLRTPDDVLEEITRIGGKGLAFAVDVSQYEPLEAAVKEVSDTFGGIHGAANMAGTIGTQGFAGKGYALEKIEDKDWDWMMAVNLTGVKNSIKAELKYIKLKEAVRITGITHEKILSSPNWRWNPLSIFTMRIEFKVHICCEILGV